MANVLVALELVSGLQPPHCTRTCVHGSSSPPQKNLTTYDVDHVLYVDDGIMLVA